MLVKGQKAQGDVLLTPADKLPEGAKKLATKTLAFGEATGHHHTMEGAATLFQEEAGPVWVVVDEPGATLVHQEHGIVTFEPGVYVYDGQVEADPFTGMARRVQD